MKEISIPYTIGNEVKQLIIIFTSYGIGQISLDKRYHVQAVFSQKNWNIYLKDKREFKNAEDLRP